MAVNILFFITFILLSAFFSGSETALFSLSSIKLRRLTQRHPKGKMVNRLLKKPTRLLSTIVFGNLLVNIAFASFSTYFFVASFGEKGLLPAIAVSGTLILLFGEIFPKTFAIYTAEQFSLAVISIIYVFFRLFSPFVIAIDRVVRICSSFIIRTPARSTLSDEEFKTALFLSKDEGQISAAEEEMIGQVLEFKDTQASEIITARIDIKGIDTASSQSEVLDFLRDKKHSKIPVYAGSPDNITGILYAKDVFLNPEEDYHKFLRTPVFIPESKKIDDLLKLFLEKHQRIAIVLDEYGGTEGLVTFEDIIEEIFGEIYDEFETVQEPVEVIDKYSWRVFGKTAIKAVNAELDLDLPEDEDTIAGFILSQLERIPRSGEEHTITTKKSVTSKRVTLHCKIERATARRIVSIIITIRSSGR